MSEPTCPVCRRTCKHDTCASCVSKQAQEVITNLRSKLAAVREELQEKMGEIRKLIALADEQDNELTRLRAEVIAMRKERDKFKDRADVLEESTTALGQCTREMSARLRKIEEAVRGHRPDCPASWIAPGPCDCGYGALQKALEGK